ncbi:MAG: LutC/YkgG family protein [Mycobacterium leprae]
MTTEQQFMTRVANAVRSSRYRPLGHELPPPEGPFGEYGSTDPEALARRLIAELEPLGGYGYLVDGPAEARALVVRLLQERELKGKVVRWADPDLAELGLDDALAAAGYEVVPFRWDITDRIPVAAEAVAGITGCDAAVAETGTLLLASRRMGEGGLPTRGRVVCLLPPIHIAIVRREKLVYSMVSVLRRLSGEGPLPADLLFVTGPSRTSDIENDLTIGVHGPGEVHAIIL